MRVVTFPLEAVVSQTPSTSIPLQPCQASILKINCLATEMPNKSKIKHETHTVGCNILLTIAEQKYDAWFRFVKVTRCNEHKQPPSQDTAK